MTHQQKSAEDESHRALAGEVLRSSRRQLLCGTGVAAIAAVLAACGTGSGDGAKDGGDAKTNTPGSTSGSQPAGPLATLAEVPVGGGITVGDLVIVQPTQGVVKAYSRSCPHMHNPVDAPKDGVITCPFHQSKFKVEDGSRISGPATTGLTEVKVTVADGKITKAA
ncbi:hypothetical protein Afil01_37520 [Actinorhabdospora filicis]|uniref:Rieske domain-containing protein n=1 Tax=Actinorhabdospora filicis TaxID=1785913 RepID=A0A9W6SN54_9ACTN|nr:Rieske (2Fe-2S) protein [Actinorhabdospora filicis]GLZ78945.1 hypothetical protein Afil01_37520 [Actinorhabdospora filicis]